MQQQITESGGIGTQKNQGVKLTNFLYVIKPRNRFSITCARSL